MDRGILGLFGKNVAASKYWFTNRNLWGPNTKKYKTATREKILHLGTQQIWRNDQETTPQGKRILLNYSSSFCISMFFFRPSCFSWGSPLHFIYMVVVFSWKERCYFQSNSRVLLLLQNGRYSFTHTSPGIKYTQCKPRMQIHKYNYINSKEQKREYTNIKLNKNY